MDLARFTESSVVIIEGVPGAGKTTLQEQLQQATTTRPVIVFPEEALLFGWIHAWIPGIDSLRMSLMLRVIEHIEQTLAEDPDTLFILTRFHISYFIFARTLEQEAYDALILKLRDLGVLVLVPQIPANAIVDRAAHAERSDQLWQAHLEKRRESSGFRDISAMYEKEQEQVRQLLQDQQVPYEILDAITR